MLKIANVDVLGWEHAIRGMRNPMNSLEKSDSIFGGKFSCGLYDNVPVSVGPNDYHLMTQLRNAGTDHRNFMQMITVYVDLTAPLYWWKEFDTYKVGTVANSCSTMHKITEKEFTLEDFSCEHLFGDEEYAAASFTADDFPEFEEVNGGWCFWTPIDLLSHTVEVLNFYRQRYLETNDKRYWWQMIQLLPSSYNQRRTVILNYEVLFNIYKSRQDHKLDEWCTFCDWIKELPYSELITI